MTQSRPFQTSPDLGHFNSTGIGHLSKNGRVAAFAGFPYIPNRPMILLND